SEKSNTLGVSSALYDSVCINSAADVVVSVALRISGHRSEHELACSNIAPDSADFLNGIGEEGDSYRIEEAVDLLHACAEGSVVSERPHGGALVVLEVVLSNVVDKVLCSLDLG